MIAGMPGFELNPYLHLELAAHTLPGYVLSFACLRVEVHYAQSCIICCCGAAGYCEQFDVHSSGATVAESVRLSGRLRLGSTVTNEQVCTQLGNCCWCQ